MTDLQGLIERLEKAEGPDRELDAAVLNATGLIRSLCRDCWGLGGNEVRGDGRKCTRCGRTDPDPLTASLDAAVAFAERVLPGWRWAFDCDGDRAPRWRTSTKPCGSDAAFKGLPETWVSALHKHAPIALLIATLRALDQQDR